MEVVVSIAVMPRYTRPSPGAGGAASGRPLYKQIGNGGGGGAGGGGGKKFELGSERSISQKKTIMVDTARI